MNYATRKTLPPTKAAPPPIHLISNGRVVCEPDPGAAAFITRRLVNVTCPACILFDNYDHGGGDCP